MQIYYSYAKPNWEKFSFISENTYIVYNVPYGKKSSQLRLFVAVDPSSYDIRKNSYYSNYTNDNVNNTISSKILDCL